MVKEKERKNPRSFFASIQTQHHNYTLQFNDFLLLNAAPALHLKAFFNTFCEGVNVTMYCSGRKRIFKSVELEHGHVCFKNRKYSLVMWDLESFMHVRMMSSFRIIKIHPILPICSLPKILTFKKLWKTFVFKSLCNNPGKIKNKHR